MLKPEVIPETKRRAINLFAFERVRYTFDFIQSNLLIISLEFQFIALFDIEQPRGVRAQG